MANEFNTYEPNRCSFVFQGQKFTQFQDSTFIEGDRKSDGWTMHEGAAGDVTRTRRKSRAGTVTLHLMSQGSDNDKMQSIADEDEQLGTGVGELQVLDLNGNMEMHASLAWIRKRPKVERAMESGGTQWVIDCADLEMNAGGNTTGTPF